MVQLQWQMNKTFPRAHRNTVVHNAANAYFCLWQSVDVDDDVAPNRIYGLIIVVVPFVCA